MRRRRPTNPNNPGSFAPGARLLAFLNETEAIDFRVASELFAPFRTLKRPDLVTLRILVTHQGKQVPSVGGLLLFGKDRHQLFPDAWIQAGRFEGTDRKQILNTAEFRKLLATAIEDTIAFLEKHMTRKAMQSNPDLAICDEQPPAGS